MDEHINQGNPQSPLAQLTKSTPPSATFVEDQAKFILSLRKLQVTDIKVLEAMVSIPRDFFVESHFRHLSYADAALEIGYEQTISQPSIVALMSQELAITKRCRVLEVGTGSGYQAAILAKLARWVYSIERIKALHLIASKRFQTLELFNIATKWGNGIDGWPQQAPFNRIIVTAAAAKMPSALLDQLDDQGIMILPLGAENQTQQLLKIERNGNQFKETRLEDVRFVPLLSGLKSG